jgi:hypothetical protein
MQGMTDAKRKALETLEAVKRLYDADESEILVGGFWSEFMSMVNGQIDEINNTMA